MEKIGENNNHKLEEIDIKIALKQFIKPKHKLLNRFYRRRFNKQSVYCASYLFLLENNLLNELKQTQGNTVFVLDYYSYLFKKWGTVLESKNNLLQINTDYLQEKYQEIIN